MKDLEFNSEKENSLHLELNINISFPTVNEGLRTATGMLIKLSSTTTS